MSSKFYLQVSFQKYAPQIAASKQSKKLRKMLRRSHATCSAIAALSENRIIRKMLR
jgi:hypothetical protein